MSTSCFAFNGIGINANALDKYINKKKIYNEISKLFPEDIQPLCEFDVDEYLGGNPYENMADLLRDLDDTDTLTYGEDEDGSSYLLYSPKFPWELTDKDPKTIEEARNIIKQTILKICDMSNSQLDSLINNDASGYLIG